MLGNRLRRALANLNPSLPPDALDDAFKRLTRPEGTELVPGNRAIHRMLVDGVTVEYRGADGEIHGGQVRVLDFGDVDANDWLAVNQFTVVDSKQNRRPDVVLFVNGLPLGVIELKNAADGTKARIGSIGAGKEWFKPWRSDTPISAQMPELQVLLFGAFEPRRFLDLIRHFIVFEDLGGGKLAKKMAGYHQFYAVNVAVEETLRASYALRSDMAAEAPGRFGVSQPGGEQGDRRVGVIWHTQGSGKSLTMAFYAGRMIGHPKMENPTIVVMTDRNDLDDQLFGTFSRCHELLRQPPVQAVDRSDLRSKLSVAAGGVVFTTIQKFCPEEKGDRHPMLSGRRNIIVIADEAHRSQYDFIDGFARHMRDALPNASFVGVTGTPIELKDANTRAVFGDYISVYDIQRAVADGATGKAMIVVMSRRIAVDLYRELIALRPDWHAADDDHGALQVVMTGSASDPLDWQPHIRNKARREDLAQRFRVYVKRILRKYGYPPDKQEKATQLVLEQAEVLAPEWAA